jgi:hypothetical protein
MRRTYIWRDGTFQEITKERPKAVHGVIEDTMPPTRHQVDGKIYDSKSAYRRVTKAAGCEEVGTSYTTGRQRDDGRAARAERINFLREAVDRRHSDGVRPLPTFSDLLRSK